MYPQNPRFSRISYAFIIPVLPLFSKHFTLTANNHKYTKRKERWDIPLFSKLGGHKMRDVGTGVVFVFGTRVSRTRTRNFCFYPSVGTYEIEPHHLCAPWYMLFGNFCYGPCVIAFPTGVRLRSEPRNVFVWCFGFFW